MKTEIEEKKSYESVKRLLDVVLSMTLLVLLSPIVAVLYFLVLLLLGTPTIFFQCRPGINEKIIRIMKFRSMTDERDKDGNLLPDELRMTSFGRFLRSTSLDELPTLVNVIKGEMSLVGPRPLLVEYLPLYNETQRRRHDVRPGITGWAQVNGRNALSWEEKFKLDVWYVENQSLALDVKILFMTIKKVLIREGISSDSSATMEKFRGNDVT